MKNYGLATPQILLPNKKVNLKKWAVVACDQYNSNEDYWRRVQRFVGNNASTLHIILPEIFLEDQSDEMIAEISAEMEAYVAGGVVEALPPGFVLVQRELKNGTRTGLVGMIDLEKYKYKPTKKTLIRPTEQTVMERIPPRMEIRKPALLESPHILLLLNDPRKKVIEPLLLRMKKFPQLYDFDLMENGGRIKGHFVGDKEEIDELYERLDMIATESDILFAVGDGNHSLATAKAVWDEFKESLSTEERKSHPKRFALVEIINLFDDGLLFEPIHRVVFDVDTNTLISDLVRIFNQQNMDAKVFFKRSSATKFISEMEGQTIDFIAKDKKGYIQLAAPAHDLEAVNFQPVLDEYLAQNPNARVEYIHGLDELARLCENDKTTGFILPKLDKESFIDVLDTFGVLPKKCFSLGEAEEKRYYLETRLLDEIMEVDRTHEMFNLTEQNMDEEVSENELEIPDNEEPKGSWLDGGNNEDVISMAFAEKDKEEDFLDVLNNNEFLYVEEEPNPEEYLTAKELKRIKKQKRLESLLKDDDSDKQDETLVEIEDLLKSVKEPKLTRKEQRLLKRQREYDYLLNQINKIKQEQTESIAQTNKEQPSTKNDQTVVASENDKNDIEKDAQTHIDVEKEIEEALNDDNGGRRSKRRQEKQAKRERMLEELEQQIAESKQDKREKDAIIEDEYESEMETAQLSRKEARKIKRQERLQALIGDLDEAEEWDEEPISEDDFSRLSKREQRRMLKEEKRRQRIEALEAQEREAEAAFNLKEVEPIVAQGTEAYEDKINDAEKQDVKRAKRLSALKEISEALSENEEVVEESEAHVSLEKARLKLEAERIKLERFRIKEEAKLQLQIERERQKALRRAEAEALIRQAKEDELSLEDVDETQGVDSDKKKTFDSRRRRSITEVISDVVHEIKHEENEESEPETVIVRRGTNEIVGKTFKVDHPKRRQKERRRKGTILVKRAGNDYH